MGIMDRIKKTKKTVEPVEEVEKKVKKAKKEEQTEKVVKAETEVAPIITKSTNPVLIRPLVTEKAARAQSGQNKYTFIVALWAGKSAVKTAIKQVYNVEPVAVHIVNVEGHRVRFGKNQGKHSDFKKAIVTLPKGKTITIHEGV